MSNRNALKELENWVNGHKSRYVQKLSIDDGYGACCWELEIGSRVRKPGDDWLVRKDYAHAILYASETNFVAANVDYPNVIYVEDGDEMDEWPGLEKLILTAIDAANKLEM